MLILTPREKQLLRRFARGKADHQIGREIGGNRRQIALQRERLLAKLQIRSHDEICEAARQLAPWPTKPRQSEPCVEPPSITSAITALAPSRCVRAGCGGNNLRAGGSRLSALPSARARFPQF